MDKFNIITLEERIVLDATIFVNIHSTAQNPDGTSWDNAYQNLQDALNKAQTLDGHDNIWVAQGTYNPTSPTTSATQSATFKLDSDVTILGGYKGSGINPNQRNTLLYQTVLDGDLNGNDSGNNISLKEDNSWHVLTYMQRTTIVLDGLTIKNGFASGHGAGAVPIDLEGGGILKNFGSGAAPDTISSLTLNNVIMKDNMAYRSASLTTLSGFVGGGAIFWARGGTLNISDSLFTNNSSSSDNGFANQGAIFANQVVANITRSSFVANTAQDLYGAIHLTNNISAHISDTSFIDNTATNLRAGAIGYGPLNASSTLLIERTLFSGNHAGGVVGGAVYLDGGPLATIGLPSGTIKDSLFINNSADGSDGGAIGAIGFSTNIVSSIFINNSATAGGALSLEGLGLNGFPNLVVSFTVKDSLFYDNVATGSPYLSKPGMLSPVDASVTGGGAIRIAGSAVVTVEGSTFLHNRALNGGAISVVGNSSVAGTGGGTLLVRNSLFLDNEATNDGGAIISKGWSFAAFPNFGPTNTTIEKSIFLNNKAGDQGGAIAGENTTLTVTSSLFLCNDAYRGGSMSLQSSNASIIGNTFFNTNDADIGDQFWISNSTVNTYNSTTSPTQVINSLKSQIIRYSSDDIVIS